MQNLIVDEQFKELLPVLDAETFASLEVNILLYGVRDPIVVWNGIVIDGHNRYAICLKHDLPFHTVEMEFSSREEVLIWIIWNQILRRNLSSIQLGYFRGVHYRADITITSELRGRNQYSEDRSQNETNPQNSATARRLAEQYNVSRSTILRNARMSEAIDAIGEVSPEAKNKILSGEVRINKNMLERLASDQTGDIAEIAARVEDGSFVRKRADNSGADATDNDANPQDSISTSSMNPFEATIARISEELVSELRKQTTNGNTGELKSALRSYIAMLEDLYSQI